MKWLTNFFMISCSNEQLQQELEYALLKPDCHSWWISKMQSGCDDTLEERYSIKLCTRETYGMIQTACGASWMDWASVFEWHYRFKKGRECVRNDERCGRSKEVNKPALIGQRVRVSEGPKPPVCRWLSIRHLVSNWLQLTQAVCPLIILLFNAHLIPLIYTGASLDWRLGRGSIYYNHPILIFQNSTRRIFLHVCLHPTHIHILQIMLKDHNSKNTKRNYLNNSMNT